MKLHTEDALLKLDEWGPIFVIGCPRSGTTFLTDCLSRLPGVEAFFGFPYLERLMHLLGSGALADDLQEEILWAIRNIFWRSLVKRRLSRWEVLKEIVQGRRAYRDIFKERQSLLEGKFLVYQEPFAVFAASILARHFPNSKFIHIIRDGRDVADSMVRSYPLALSDEVLKDLYMWRQKGTEVGLARHWNGWWIPWWVEQGREQEFIRLSRFGRYVWMWKEMVQRGRSLKQFVGDRRYLEIRYENLCRNPVGTGEEILRFLETTAGYQFWRGLKRASTRSIGAHKRQSATIINEAHRVAGFLLKDLGYM